MDSVEEVKSCDVVCLFGFSEEDAKVFSGKTVIFFAEGCKERSFHGIYYDGKNCDIESFQTLCESLVFLRFGYVIHPRISEDEKVAAEMWMSRCLAIEWQVQLSAADYCDFGLTVFKNLYRSLKKPSDSDSFFAMKDAFQGVPAFICGAGPSAEEEFVHLHDLQNRGLIFAGGAALGLMGRLGAPLHIAAGIDPNPFYDKVLMQHAFEVPFFYQSRFSSSLLDTVQGAMFQVPSNPGYPLEFWLQEGRCFDGGWTVSTLCAALAVHLGCSPIVLIGVDLSYDKENNEATSWDDPLQGKMRTQKDWVLASKWLEALASENKETVFYTSSKEGISIKGVEEISLAEAKETLFEDRYDTEGLTHQIRSLWNPSVDVKEKADKIEKSLTASFAYVNTLLHFFEKHYPDNPKDKGEFVLNSVELQEEIVYQTILQPLWNVWQFPLHRQFEDPYAKEINRLLFFKKILQEYKTCPCKF